MSALLVVITATEMQSVLTQLEALLAPVSPAILDLEMSATVSNYARGWG